MVHRLGLALVLAGGFAGAQELALGGALGRLARLEGGAPFRCSSTDPTGRNADYRWVRPQEELILADMPGPGVIRHLWMTVDPGREMPASARKLLLTMIWDDSPEPAVEVPVGDFFGMGLGVRHDFWTLPMRVSAEGRAMNCFLPMPFRRRARIGLRNLGDRSVLAYWNVTGVRGSLPADAGWFHALYTQQVPDLAGPEHEVLRVAGGGLYVGTLVSIQQTWPGWPGEGDDRFYVDGDPNPTLEGTGLEDYFLDAWDFRPSASPFYAVTLSTGYRPGSLHSALRWHVEDPIPFHSSLRVVVEQWGRSFDREGRPAGNGERRDNYSSVAYFYLNRPFMAQRPGLPSPQELVPVPVVPEERLLKGPVIEAEAQAGVKAEGRTEMVADEAILWGGGGLLRWHPERRGARLELPLGEVEPGAYQAWVTLRRGQTGGVFHLSLAGGEEVLLDSYLDRRRELCFPERCLVGSAAVAAGRRPVLLVRAEGRNAFAPALELELDRIELEKLEKGPAGPEGGGDGKSGEGGGPGLPEVVVPAVAEELVMDGVLEPAWRQAAAVELRQARSGETLPAESATQVLLVADPKGLCLAFLCKDLEVTSPYAGRDQSLWLADVVELFLDADGDGRDYLEIEVSPAGMLFDAFFLEPRQGRLLSWDPPLAAGAKVLGTLDQPGDRDDGWLAEVRVPWAEVAEAGGQRPPAGAIWRANLYRVDKGPGERLQGQAWAVVPEGDFHSPARFGRLRFAGPAR